MGLKFKLVSFYFLVLIGIFNFIYLFHYDLPLFSFGKTSLNNRNSLINCSLILQGNLEEIQKADRLLKSQVEKRIETNSSTRNHDCSNYHTTGYINLSEFELSFPIAFSILTYENAEQFDRLLKLIYRPHNIYCIHIDSKSPRSFHLAVRSIVNCFKNVFIATKLERIVYAGFSRLKADLNCMNDIKELTTWTIQRKSKLWSHENLAEKSLNNNWKYLINLASSEFPLRTNYELAKILDLLDGQNDIEIMRSFQQERIKYKWIVNEKKGLMVRTNELKTSPPFNYTIVKGIAYCLFSRRFVEYALTNEHAKSLLEWSQDTYSPDEWYWASLQYNSQFKPPGSFASITRRSFVPTMSRFIGWKSLYNCRGKLRHNICVFSLGDLNNLIKRNELFVNKLDLNEDPFAYQCMQEWYLSRMANQSQSTFLDMTPYISFANKLKILSFL